MSIHAIDFAAASNTDSYLINSYIPQWLVTHTAWEQQTNKNPYIVQADPVVGTPEHYRGGPWRFAWSAAKSTLMSNLVAYTQSYSGDWWRIRWHECKHDQDGPCEWTDIRSSNTPVPGGV